MIGNTPTNTTNICRCDTFALGVRHIDKNIQQSPESSSWIVYRQNQFKLQCYITGALRHYNTPVASVESIPPSRAPPQLFVHGDSAVVPVEGLYFYLYAIKQHENEDKITDESKVALHQVGPSRTKRETKAPDLLPIVDGMLHAHIFPLCTHIPTMYTYFHHAHSHNIIYTTPAASSLSLLTHPIQVRRCLISFSFKHQHL